MNMATSERGEEDVRHMEVVAKKTQTTPMKIGQMKLNSQTVEKTIFSWSHDIQKREDNTKSNICEMKLTLTSLLHGRWNQSEIAINQTITELSSRNYSNWNQMIG